MRKKQLAEAEWLAIGAMEQVKSDQALRKVREGDTNHSKTRLEKKSSCHRPGCEASWTVDPKTPHKKFCSSLCDNALRAAVTRIERYYRSLGYVGAIRSSNRMQVLLAKPGSRVQLRAFERVVLRC